LLHKNLNYLCKEIASSYQTASYTNPDLTYSLHLSGSAAHPGRPHQRGGQQLRDPQHRPRLGRLPRQQHSLPSGRKKRLDYMHPNYMYRRVWRVFSLTNPGLSTHPAHRAGPHVAAEGPLQGHAIQHRPGEMGLEY